MALLSPSAPSGPELALGRYTTSIALGGRPGGMLGMSAPLHWPSQHEGGSRGLMNVPLERAWIGAEHAYIMRRPLSLPNFLSIGSRGPSPDGGAGE